jgi:hypothetical protein
MTVISTSRSAHDQERLKDMMLCLLECVLKETQFSVEMADELINLLEIQNTLGSKTEPRTQRPFETLLLRDQLIELTYIANESRKVLQVAAIKGVPGSDLVLRLISNYRNKYKGPKP